MVQLLPTDSVKEGDWIKIAWRRNRNSLKSEAIQVVNSSVTVNQSFSLNTEMLYDTRLK